MTQTADWDLLFDLLDSGWPGELTEGAAAAYRTLLDGVPSDTIIAGIRRLLHAGARFRPTAAEILGEARRDPSRPTFDEALALLFRRRGVLDVRVRGTVDSNPNHRVELRDKVNERLAEMHPLVAGFVRRIGLDRLRSMNIDDPVDGHWRRKELREAWQDYIDASDNREVATLAIGGGSHQLRQLDPLAALSLPAGRRALSEPKASEPA
jgi:hypothetical protein